MPQLELAASWHVVFQEVLLLQLFQYAMPWDAPSQWS